MTETSRFVGPILKFLFPNISDGTLITVHSVVRKVAHVTEYAVLAYLAVRALSSSSVDKLRRWRFLLPLVFIFIIATTDEFNQSFISSRTASAWDSVLDIFGGVFAIAACWYRERRRLIVRMDDP